MAEQTFGRLGQAVLSILVCLPCSGQQQTPSFRSEVNLVNLTVIVRSESGSLVHDLQKDDFEVLEDGAPQKILFLNRDDQRPLSLGLVRDVSGSQDKFVKEHTKDIETFLTTVLRPSDQAFAVCFGNHLRLVQDFTSSGEEILRGIKTFDKNGGKDLPEIGPKESRELGTALYDAVFFSIAEKLKAPGERRQALLVFSDGEENSSEHDLLDAIEESQNTDTLIYCIRYTQKEHGHLTARNKYGTRVMHHMAVLTGGLDFDALTTSLPEVFEQISEELRSTYQMGYISSNSGVHDGAFRKIQVRCKRPGSLTRAKSGYYAN